MSKRPTLTLDSFKKKDKSSAHSQIVKSVQPTKNKSDVKRNAGKTKVDNLINDEDYHAILSYMQGHYPKSFPPKLVALPLALGIHNQLFEVNDFPFSKTKIRQFLKRYTASREYRASLIVGNDRFDLNGKPTSRILEEEVDTKKWKKLQAKNKAEEIKKANHDSLIKKAMENPIAAAEFLSEYLPTEFKEFVDLTTLKIEKESYVEDSLKTRFSDIVYSAKTKAENQEKADTTLIYCLLEHQSKPDYWIAFRLMKYSLLLLEQHAKKRNKLPVIMPLVLYNGTKKYSAPLNLWQLFSNPELAKKAMSEDYNLIDLYTMSDEDINYEKHLSFLLYCMKHIHDRDILAMLEEAMRRCKQALIIDKGQDYVHTKLILWYSDAKVPLEQKKMLEQLIVDNLPKEDTDKIMKTIADTYIEEGIAIGEARGVTKGATNKVIEIASRMLQEKTDIKFISSVTGLSNDDILKLRNKM